MCVWGRGLHFTCKEGHEHGHPAQYVGPGKAPVTKAPPQEVDCHSSINGHTQQNKESWVRETMAHVSYTYANIIPCVSVW